MLKKIALILLLIAPMSVFAQKFGHIKSQEILNIMPDYTKAQNEIKAEEKQYMDEIQRASDELNKSKRLVKLLVKKALNSNKMPNNN